MNRSSLATIAPLDLSYWHRVPNALVAVAGLLALTIVEAMGLGHPVPTQIPGGELDETEGFAGGAPRTNGGAA